MKMLDDSFLETSVVHIVHFWRNCNIIRYSIYSFKKLYNAIFNVMILKLATIHKDKTMNNIVSFHM